MKKKIVLLLVASLTVCSLIGCGKKEEAANNTVETTQEQADIDVDVPDKVDEAQNEDEAEDSIVPLSELVRPDVENMEFENYVEVGDYKNLDFSDLGEAEEVTDEDIGTYINNILTSYASFEAITDRTSQAGDRLNIDFACDVDGEAPEGTSGEDCTFILGQNTFLKEFEDALYDVNQGDIVNVEVHFPDDYAEEVAGKTGKFTIVVNSIEKVIYPELNDETVRDISSTASTVDELKEEVRNTLMLSNKAAHSDDVLLNVTDKVKAISKVKEYPEDLYKYYYDMMYSFYGEYANAYQTTVSDFLEKYCDMTLEEFDKETITFAEDSCLTTLAMHYIGKQEGITITDAEINDMYKQRAEEYGYDTVDEFLEELDMNGGREETKEEFLFVKIAEKVVEPSRCTIRLSIMERRCKLLVRR